MTSSITRACKIFHQLFALPKQHRVEVVDVVARSPHGIRIHTERIFLLLYVAIAILRCCSLDYVFSISYDLGGRCIVSTHLGIVAI